MGRSRAGVWPVRAVRVRAAGGWRRHRRRPRRAECPEGALRFPGLPWRRSRCGGLGSVRRGGARGFRRAAALGGVVPWMGRR